MNEVLTTPEKKQVAEGSAKNTAESSLERLRINQNNIFDSVKKEQQWNQQGKSDPIVGSDISGMTPGKMAMEAKMKLHSRLSINLFRGRQGDPKNNMRPIIGLARFARQVAMVWTAAAQDDPFADQTLINIEVAFEEGQRQIQSRLDALGDLVDGMEEFEVSVQTSEKPVELELKFFSPWAFRASLLLKKFDQLVRKALTARHLGLFTEDDWKNVVHESQRALRHMFVEVDSWVSTGVKRDDMDKGTRIAKRAAAVYMELKHGYLVLDSEVMEGHHRAKLSPPNRLLIQRLEKREQEAQKKAATQKKHESTQSEDVTPDTDNDSV